MISACARTCSDTFVRTGYASLLVPDTSPGPSPFAAVTKVTLEHASGTSVSTPHLRWGFGYGPTHNRLGSCVNVGRSWTREMFAALSERNKHNAELLSTTHVRIEAWAHRDLLGYALDSILTDHPDDMYDVERLHRFTVRMNIARVVDARLPLNPDDWWMHPDVASGVVRCA